MEKWLPGVKSCMGGEYLFPPLSVVTPYAPLLLSPGRCPPSKRVPVSTPAPQIRPPRGEASQPSRGLPRCSLYFWAALLPGGVMKTHNAVSFSWIPSAFSIQHIIQEILVYTFEELP